MTVRVSVHQFTNFMYYLVTLNFQDIIFNSGENPIYNCVSSSAIITSVEWLINGTRLQDLSLTNVVTEFSQLSRRATLVFTMVSVKYNNTNIQCRATLSNGETVDSSNSTLLVQGVHFLIVAL